MLGRKQSVLVVDDLEETREVLKTALERRGLDIFTCNRADQGLEMARLHHPDLIVLDLEMANSDSRSVRGAYEKETIDQDKPLVLLGTARRSAPSGGQFVAKPYHYGVLVDTIEELLNHTSLQKSKDGEENCAVTVCNSGE